MVRLEGLLLETASVFMPCVAPRGGVTAGICKTTLLHPEYMDSLDWEEDSNWTDGTKLFQKIYD